MMLNSKQTPVKPGMKIMSVALSAPQEIKYSSSKKNHILFGADDLYPQHLLSILNESPTASGILKYKTGLMNAKGWEGNEDLGKEWIKISKEFNTFNSYALKIGWSRDKSTIVRIEHINLSWVRIGPPNELGDITFYEVSEDWTNKKAPVKTYQAFDPKNIDETFIQIFYYTAYTQDMRYYSLPDYFSATKYIELEGELANYHLKNVQGGFTPTTVITLPTALMSEEEEDALFDGLEASATGKDGKRFIVLYGDGNNTPTITTIDGLQEAAAKELDDLTVQKICTGMRLSSPTLASLPGDGGLASSERETASMYYYNETVVPCINELEQSFKSFLKFTDDKTFTVNRIEYGKATIE